MKLKELFRECCREGREGLRTRGRRAGEKREEIGKIV